MGSTASGQANGTTHIPATGVYRLQHLIVNSYLVGEPGAGPWAVVDAGLSPFCGARIIREAEKRFGRGTAPEAIVLTHGHFDHVGGLHKLLEHWDVPVYAHEWELPYLTGRSSYPPGDPTVGGGLMARLARLYPRRPMDLGARVKALPSDGVLPGMPGWRWLPTPGHSPGHVSLFRFSDRALIAGDAFVTVKQESLTAVLAQKQQVSRPPAYFTPDWEAAYRSLEHLLSLEPEIAATGHGVPMHGEEMRAELRELVSHFRTQAVPKRGRYVQKPAIADAHGVVSVPPPVFDLVPKLIAGTVAALALVTVLGLVRKRNSLNL